MNGCIRIVFVCLLLAAGCNHPVPTQTPHGPPELAAAFNSSAAGTISGQVLWEGTAPQISPFRITAGAAAGREFANPNSPLVDEQTRGVADAMVFLRKVDPRQSRPWDWPAARVEMRDFDYRVCQGASRSRTGIVRVGTAVEMESQQPVMHAVRARGAAFFTLAFPDANTKRERVFDRPGVVELGSGTNHYWARAYLFVAEHPYFARTDREGRFTLPQVPPGDYELVCWLPSWHEKDHERDADSWQISRITFQPAVEITQAVRVGPGAASEAHFSFSAAMFDR